MLRASPSPKLPATMQQAAVCSIHCVQYWACRHCQRGLPATLLLPLQLHCAAVPTATDKRFEIQGHMTGLFCLIGHALQDVLDWLLANREDSLTPAQIQEKFGYVCLEGSQLHKSLLANSKIGVSADGAFTYKVRRKQEVIALPYKLPSTARYTLHAATK